MTPELRRAIKAVHALRDVGELRDIAKLCSFKIQRKAHEPKMHYNDRTREAIRAIRMCTPKEIERVSIELGPLINHAMGWSKQDVENHIHALARAIKGI